jgi:hypothetical protein
MAQPQERSLLQIESLWYVLGGVNRLMKNFCGKLIYADAPPDQAETEALRRYGWSDDEIAGMTAAQRRAEFQEAMEIDFLREQAADQVATAPGPLRPDGGREVPPEAGTSTPPGPEPSPTGGAPLEQTEIEGLKRHGWSEEEIAAMSPKTRRQFFQEAMETGRSEPTAEFAPWRENPSKPVEGAPRTRLTKDLSGKLIYGGLGVIFLWTICNVVFKQRDGPQVIPGWEGISTCSFMVSFDGKRRLWLSENHFARIEEPDQASADGSWSFDESTSKYAITVRNESITYSVVAPGGGDNCMLIKGDLATADLPRSWFYSRGEVDDQSDYEPLER